MCHLIQLYLVKCACCRGCLLYTSIGPIEKEEGYDESFSAAVNIATAPTGLLIPPSNVLITYSLVSGGTSVAALFIGGYIPGILWGISCMIVAYFYAKKRGYRSAERVDFKTGVKVALQALPSLMLIVIVIGGIIAGVFTATEGSAIAVAYSLILSLFFYKTIDLKELWAILKDSAKSTGIIIFLCGTSNIMGWVLSFTGIPEAISAMLLGISDNPVVILLILNVFLLFVGTFMDIIPAIMIFTPIFLPICESFGMNSLHFGIMITYNLCIGCITPPVGNILFVGVKDVYKRQRSSGTKEAETSETGASGPKAMRWAARRAPTCPAFSAVPPGRYTP